MITYLQYLEILVRVERPAIPKYIHNSLFTPYNDGYLMLQCRLCSSCIPVYPIVYRLCILQNYQCTFTNRLEGNIRS